jgi:Na+/H+ antiporter NhaD/arsenite permease-like protein
MTLLTSLIVCVFVIGYGCIAFESVLKINKSAVALLMCVVCWALYMVDPVSNIMIMHPGANGGQDILTQASNIIELHLGDTAETLFFLLGAMTIVEVVDSNGGFNFVRDLVKTKSKRALMWRIAFIAFFLSAILDNMTTTIVMIMILRKLIADHKDRIIYASLVVIAANAGGAFSPIGDVTTIMLWIGGMITSAGILKEMFIPSVVSLIVSTFILQFALKGNIEYPEDKLSNSMTTDFSSLQRKIIFIIGVGGLCFVPVFRYLTNLPPFMGILLVLALLWIAIEVFFSRLKLESTSMSKRVGSLLHKIDISTILFFLGILMAVSCLEEVGVLHSLGQGLNTVSGGNHYLVTGSIGIASSIIDNVPLVAGCMGMYPIMPTGDMAVDGIFWQLLAYCAGFGGSLLIIGSAAGVVAMGLEKITFGWYMRRISWVAFIGYIAGIGSYWLLRTFIF